MSVSVGEYKRCRKKTQRGERCKRPVYYIKNENNKLCKLHFLREMYDDDPFEPSDVSSALVIPGVYIGSISAAQKDYNFLKKHKIKSILNASGMEPKPSVKSFYTQNGIQYKTFTTHNKDGREKFMPDKKFDRNFTKLDFFAYVLDGVKFMKTAPKPVLCNCHAGINRSGSCIAAYMMLVKKIPYEKTIKLLEKANAKRGWSVLTNPQFRKALKELEERIKTRRNIKSGKPPSATKKTKRRSKSPNKIKLKIPKTRTTTQRIRSAKTTTRTKRRSSKTPTTTKRTTKATSKKTIKN